MTERIHVTGYKRPNTHYGYEYRWLTEDAIRQLGFDTDHMDIRALDVSWWDRLEKTQYLLAELAHEFEAAPKVEVVWRPELTEKGATTNGIQEASDRVREQNRTILDHLAKS